MDAASCRFVACIVIAAVPPLAASSSQDAALHFVCASSGAWLVYLSHKLTCKYMQHHVDFPCIAIAAVPSLTAGSSRDATLHLVGASSGVWHIFHM